MQQPLRVTVNDPALPLLDQEDEDDTGACPHQQHVRGRRPQHADVPVSGKHRETIARTKICLKLYSFQAVVVKTADLESGKKYYITAGAEYGNEQYVWVSQREITTALEDRVGSTSLQMINCSRYHQGFTLHLSRLLHESISRLTSA